MKTEDALIVKELKSKGLVDEGDVCLLCTSATSTLAIILGSGRSSAFSAPDAIEALRHFYVLAVNEKEIKLFEVPKFQVPWDLPNATLTIQRKSGGVPSV